jgi:hypothetical protein
MQVNCPKKIAASLKDLDTDKIKLELANAMKAVDLASLQKEISQTMKEVEWNKISAEVQHSLDQAKKEIEHINTDAINKQLENAKLEIERSKTALEKIDFDKIIKEAGENVEKAKEMLQLQKEFFNELEKKRIDQSQRRIHH